jgi:hypothetical protein
MYIPGFEFRGARASYVAGLARPHLFIFFFFFFLLFFLLSFFRFVPVGILQPNKRSQWWRQTRVLP